MKVINQLGLSCEEGFENVKAKDDRLHSYIIIVFPTTQRVGWFEHRLTKIH